MSIIVVGSSKGGSGKSTLCTNLIARHLATGATSLLLDGDAQRSSSSWAATRDQYGVAPEVVSMEKLGPDLKRSALEMGKHYDAVFIDVPGNNSPELRAALLVADLLVYPIRPSNFDAWVFHSDMTELVSSARTYNESLRVMLVMNGLAPAPAERQQQILSLREYLADYSGFYLSPHFLCHRNAFIAAIKEGRGVVEMAGRNESLGKAKLELDAVYSDAMKTLAGARPAAYLQQEISQ
ncbi:division plane positioning ATPase MipZ [Denitromonas halophila]|uniref:Chromosome partitioning protein n=1 Tax=Denitromonas halophila TaxID=1629404 RepID=A0A557QSN8_9RHOO|nr:division plane positioning ATPase MipZ [Denitromonas halophila]TVO55933.1 chromosome partitioning protein [Denitromonas halophila]